MAHNYWCNIFHLFHQQYVRLVDCFFFSYIQTTLCCCCCCSCSGLHGALWCWESFCLKMTEKKNKSAFQNNSYVCNFLWSWHKKKACMCVCVGLKKLGGCSYAAGWEDVLSRQTAAELLHINVLAGELCRGIDQRWSPPPSQAINFLNWFNESAPPSTLMLPHPTSHLRHPPLYTPPPEGC